MQLTKINLRAEFLLTSKSVWYSWSQDFVKKAGALWDKRNSWSNLVQFRTPNPESKTNLP